MSKLLQALYDRLAERMAALFGKLMASHAEALHAEQEAECQNRLEELARRYEAEGKPEIAATLRQRARLIPGDNPAGLGAALLDQLGGSASPATLPALQPPEPPPVIPAVPPPTLNAMKPGRRKLTLPPDSPFRTGEGQS